MISLKKGNSPFIEFTDKSWSELRKDTPLNLTAEKLEELRGTNEVISLEEVEKIYLPLSRLLYYYVEAQKKLHLSTNCFLGGGPKKVPYIIGLAGSVAAGKSTMARVLQHILSKWDWSPKVEILTTDGYLYGLDELKKKKLLERKGFPESYRQKDLLQTIIDIKSGSPFIKVPLYCHKSYDILRDKHQILESPDILILEGLNVFHVGVGTQRPLIGPFISDFFDFGIYLDASLADLEKWFLNRFHTFFSYAKERGPEYYLYQFRHYEHKEIEKFARDIWTNINKKNLLENILPFKTRADLILTKNSSHSIEHLHLRKI